MRSQGFNRRALLWSAVRGAIRLSDWARKSGPAVLLCALVLSLGAAYMATSTVAASGLWKGWTRIFGHPAPVPAYSAGMPIPESGDGGDPTYALTSFDAPGGGAGELEGTVALGINASGAITGVYSNAFGVTHGFIRTGDGSITTFDAPDAGSTSPGVEGTIPVSINANGDVAGICIDANHGYHGFVRSAADGTITEFDAPDAPTNVANRGTAALGINDAGEIVGIYTTGGLGEPSTDFGFLRAADGTITSLTEPDAGSGENAKGNKQGTWAVGINASGEIVGDYIDSESVQHGFVLSTTGTYTSFDPPGSTTTNPSGVSGTLPSGIDAAGDVTGFFTDSSAVQHGFVRTASGTITTFDAPGSAAGAGTVNGTAVLGIDPGGNYIVGLYSDSTGLSHGYVYAQPLSGSGTFTTFEAPGASIVSGAPVSGTAGYGVNASGVLSGAYSDSSGVLHGLELTLAPVTPAMTSPTPGSTLTGGSVTFQWNPGSGATNFVLKAGTTGPESTDVYSGAPTAATSATVTVPTNGVTLYVTLYYDLNGTRYALDYTYTESGAPTPPSMTSPVPGSTLTSGSVTFTWNPGAGVTDIVLKVGTTGPGSANVYNRAPTALTSATVTVPTTGATLYVTLYYDVNGLRNTINYTYTEAE
jgi:hypothetical protein